MHDVPEHGLEDSAVRERLARVERKPPLYRAFRWSLYGIYVAVAAWLVGSITVAVWQSVYGPGGDALRAAETRPVAAPQAEESPLMETVKLPQSALLDALQNRPKHVFVSGASRGIGESIARLLGEGNARLTLGARSYNQLLGVAMDVGTDRAHALRLDLSDERSIDEAVVAAESRFGPIDVLVCNAGIHADTPLDDASAEGRARFRKIIDVNLTGTFFLAQLASLHMPAGGRIIFIGSVLGRFGVPRSVAYVASKHALMGVVRSMAHELAPRNIRVNAINPGWVDTRMAHESLGRMAQLTGKTLQQVTAEQLKQQAIRRMVKPEEVAAYVQFLIGPGGEAITGQGIDISCGSVMV